MKTMEELRESWRRIVDPPERVHAAGFNGRLMDYADGFRAAEENVREWLRGITPEPYKEVWTKDASLASDGTVPIFFHPDNLFELCRFLYPSPRCQGKGCKKLATVEVYNQSAGNSITVCPWTEDAKGANTHCIDCACGEVWRSALKAVREAVK